MQSTGQTSRHDSQPVQLSALMIATSLGSFLRGPALAIYQKSFADKHLHCDAAASEVAASQVESRHDYRSAWRSGQPDSTWPTPLVPGLHLLMCTFASTMA